MFSFTEAQKYELEASKQWLNNNYYRTLKEINRLRSHNIIQPQTHYLDLFFKNDINKWNEFVNFVKDKNCLEVGSGPCGIIPLWGHWLEGQLKAIIDPLIDEYEGYLFKTYNASWFPSGTFKYATKVEELVSFLINKIDGFIIFRNALDHLENPQKALENISKYATTKCKFLFWSDVLHIENPDEGHCNVGKPEEVMQIIKNVGFKLEYSTPSIRDNTKVIDCGGVFTKL